jgi:hypothetical protein
MIAAILLAAIAAAGVAFFLLREPQPAEAPAPSADPDPVEPDPNAPGPPVVGTDPSECADENLSRFARAIAFAEGFYVQGARPNRNNNPGDFKGSGDAGTDGTYAVYSTPEAGWGRLCRQLRLIRDERSLYKLDWTIERMSETWSPEGAANWAKNVSDYLGTTRLSTLRQFLA